MLKNISDKLEIRFYSVYSFAKSNSLDIGHLKAGNNRILELVEKSGAVAQGSLIAKLHAHRDFRMHCMSGGRCYLGVVCGLIGRLVEEGFFQISPTEFRS